MTGDLSSITQLSFIDNHLVEKCSTTMFYYLLKGLNTAFGGLFSVHDMDMIKLRTWGIPSSEISKCIPGITFSFLESHRLTISTYQLQ